MRGISVKRTHSLFLNLFDDESVHVDYVGMFDGKKWYSWNTFGPTEGLLPDYDSHLVTEEQIIERIELLLEYDQLTPNDQLAVNIFFGKSVTFNQHGLNQGTDYLL